MLFLLLNLGRCRYALEARRVVEVLPILALKPCRHAPAGVAGVVEYRGRPVPAVDLSELKLGRPAAQVPGTRIVVTHWPDGGETQMVGLLTESRLELVSAEKLAEAALPPAPAADAGAIQVGLRGPIQRFRHEELLPGDFGEVLRANAQSLWSGQGTQTVPGAVHALDRPRAGSRISALVFRLEQEWLALPTQALEQVAQQQPIHSLPHRPQHVLLGLANIRGELVTCFSLGHLLDLQSATSCQALRRQHHRLLVVNWAGTRLAFPVAEVHGPEHFESGQLEIPPATGLTYTRNLLPWRQRAVGLLDPELLFPTLYRRLR